MPKESRILSMKRVSPYPLRSSRTKKEPESLIQTQGPSQWEDVQCVICQEPPHNAVLLKCPSFSNGCRPYICDTSGRHSNCLKQYRKKNKNRVTKAIKCPYCRGDVYETMKVLSSARRYLNAKSRSCAFEDCTFSGTYSQLKNHLKAEHPPYTQPLVDHGRERAWEHMQRVSEYSAILTAAGIPHMPEEVLRFHLPYGFPFQLQVMINGVVQTGYFVPHVRSGFGVPNSASPPLMRGGPAMNIIPNSTP